MRRRTVSNPPGVDAVVREAWGYLVDAMRNERFNAPVRVQAAQAICAVYATDTKGLMWEMGDGTDENVSDARWSEGEPRVIDGGD